MGSAVLLSGGTIFCPSPWWRGFALLSVLFLAPGLYIYVDAIRRDHILRSRSVIFYQPIPPLTQKPEKQREPDGQEEFKTRVVYWYMDADDVASHFKGLSAIGQEILASYRIAAGIYRGEVTNDFLQFFDSFGLYKFLVGNENPKTVMACAELALYYEGARDGFEILKPVSPLPLTTKPPPAGQDGGQAPPATTLPDSTSNGQSSGKFKTPFTFDDNDENKPKLR